MKRKALGLASLGFSATCTICVVALTAFLLSVHSRAETTSPPPRLGAEQSEDAFPVVDWDYWMEVNPDVIGWVTVPGTEIDYPIVQAPQDDPTYYLDRNVYREWSYMGCPYLDAGCAEGGLFDGPSTVLFGHNLGLGDTSMFAAFANFVDEEYAKDHRVVLIQSPNRKEAIRVLAVACVGGWEALKRTSFVSEDDFAAYCENLLRNADVVLSDGVEGGPFYTFVTCSYNYWSDERALVFAQLQVDDVGL